MPADLLGSSRDCRKGAWTEMRVLAGPLSWPCHGLGVISSGSVTAEVEEWCSRGAAGGEGVLLVLCWHATVRDMHRCTHVGKLGPSYLQLGFGQGMLISTVHNSGQSLTWIKGSPCLLASALITAVSVVSSSLS